MVHRAAANFVVQLKKGTEESFFEAEAIFFEVKAIN